eukprot:473045-Pyramimonas_sp.AAC.1
MGFPGTHRRPPAPSQTIIWGMFASRTIQPADSTLDDLLRPKESPGPRVSPGGRRKHGTSQRG